MGSLSIWHWMVVLLVATLVFGTKKLRNVGEDLGHAVKGFREGLRENTDSGASSAPARLNAVDENRPHE